MRHYFKRAILVSSFILSALLPVHNAYATPIAHLTLNSEPGDYIGQGMNFDITYTPTNLSLFFAEAGLAVDPSNDPSELRFILGTVTSGFDNTFALLSFGTSGLDIPFQGGVFLDAERADFALPGHPGLDISFQNRGCNTVAGNFTVNDVSFSNSVATATGSSIETFSVSFEQHCNGDEPALYGTFSYRAFGVPEPGSILLVLSLLPLVPVGRLRRLAKSGRSIHPSAIGHKISRETEVEMRDCSVGEPRVTFLVGVLPRSVSRVRSGKT